MTDFTRIRGLSDGQRQAFEELVCQLARRENEAGAEFRRVEGSGGDGGVEAYWLLPGGSKIGYQAKYFTRAGDIDWRQIDESVEQALKTHLTLTKYVIAIPCDLTDRRGIRGKGQTGWELWATHRAEWQRKWLTPEKRTVEFIPWTAFELRDKLVAPSAEGLRRYWFGTTEFSPAWFRDHVNLAITSLDERYHPEDHVDVALEKLFQFVARDQKAVSALQDHLEAIRRSPFPSLRSHAHEPKLPAQLLDKATASLAALLSLAPEFDLPCWQEWDAARWKTCSANLSDNIEKIREWVWSVKAALPENDNDKAQDIRRILSSLHNIDDAIEHFDNLIGGQYLSAERDRSALVEGRAGTGKSHLLGRIAELAVSEGRPVILLLGQQLGDQPLWDQLTKRLGLENLAPDPFLQALDAAAEAARKRGIVLVDAINEGAGSRLWKPEIAEFLARLKRFPNLACVITCRTEYVRYVIPEGILSNIQMITIKGFESADEKLKAARIYLDRRGISRPSTPWIAPEFVNPLFVRSTCLALSREKKTEFPKGLHGTKEVLSFYLRSVGRNLGVGRDGSDDLVPATVATLRAIAASMATNRTDYVSLAEATDIAAAGFSPFTPPTEQSWLDVVHRNGLLRYDPDPTCDTSDPLAIVHDVVRFSFQRFQDHLMSETLLETVSDIRKALATGGPLAFIHTGKTLEWQWQGLVQALSIQAPERFAVELIDALPGDFNRWWRIWQLRDAFAESVRWRNKGAFNDRTLELLNLLPGTNVDPTALLIELSASVEHPWNADFLHRNLIGRKLPRRDQFWTVWINDASVEADDPVGRLIDWCLFGQSPDTDRGAQRLCGIMLCWFFTSSNRYVRDTATKALVSLLISRTDLFPDLCKLFKDVDDIYVSERLLGAAFGACCINPSRFRLESYAASTYDLVFAEGEVPLSLLLRDYARGIIELSLANAALPSHISLERCRPPYRSPPPRLNVSEDALKRTAGNAGDETILRSCSSFMGDFASYEIKPRVGYFTAVGLRRPQPVSNREMFKRFEAEVINIDTSRISAIKALREKHSPQAVLRLTGIVEETPKAKQEAKQWASNIIAAEEVFLKLLSPSERRRYQREAKRYLGLGTPPTAPNLPEFDIAKAQRWVAKRAYDTGWTKKLFSDDSSRYRDNSRDRPNTERIGKKYQWIALDELLCRLADNYWIGNRYDGPSKLYDNPLDVGFDRDIDPTVIPISDELDNSQGPRPEWVHRAYIELTPVEEEELAAWPFLVDPAAALTSRIQQCDLEGKTWVTLYEHRSAAGRYGEGNPRFHGLRQQEFHFVMCAVVAKADRKRLVDFLATEKRLDVMDWDPPEYTDGPFLREAPWRNTWSQNQWSRDVRNGPKGMGISFPACRYHWESHLDASLPEGARALIPAPWLAKALALAADDSDGSCYKNAAAQIIFIGSKLAEGGSSALIAKETFDHYLDANDLQCLWLFVGERGAWPGGENTNAAWRRSEGLCWLEDGKPTLVTWKSDNANGASSVKQPTPVANTGQARTQRRRNTSKPGSA